MNYQARYVTLNDDIFLKKIAQADRIFSKCSLCPHRCGVNRSDGELGFCKAGAEVEVAHHQLHFGEEPPLSNYGGAGAIFFYHCNLKCAYCQNFQISQRKETINSTNSNLLSSMMIELQNKGAQNIDLVSPTHFVPLIITAIYQARGQGLKVPIVYNTNAYESPQTLDILSGIVDIYMPDFKYFNERKAFLYSGINNYVASAKRAIKMMYAQTGSFILDDEGRARSGLLIRHLVLPEKLAGSKDILDFLKKEVGLDIGLSVMSQYAPCYEANKFEELNRKINPREYNEVIEYAEKLGFTKCWIQQLQSNAMYFPDFKSQKVF